MKNNRVLASEGQQSKQFLENKEIVQTVLESIDKQSLEEIKVCMEKVTTSIKKRKNAYSQFTDLKDLLNSIRDGKGRGPLHFVASRGDIKIFDYILSLGADHTLEDEEKNTPFFICAQHGHLELLKHIIQKFSIDPLTKRGGDASAIHLAASNGDIKTIEFLLSKGANVQEPSNFGYPINWAAGYNHQSTVEFLLKQGASANGDTKGVIPSPLILSVDYGKQDLFDLLLSHGADVNINDGSGWSVLHLCAEKGNIPFMRVLLSKGANPNYINQRKTPLQLAFEKGHMDLFAELKTHTSHEIDHVLAQEFKDMQLAEKEDVEFVPKTIDTAKATELKDEGNELFKNKKFEEAIAVYKQAADQDSNIVAVFTNIAACYIQLKKFADALKFTERAKKVDKEWMKTYFREGEAYNGLENYAEAASSFWECVKRDPTSKLYNDLFKIAMAKGKIQYAQNSKKQ